MPTLQVVRIASGAGLMLIAALCSGISCGSTGADCATVTFTLTPELGGDPFDIQPEACTHAPAVGDCTLEVFDIDGTNRYFQYGSAGFCLGVFEATIDDGAGNEYFLGGDTLRTFGVGSGPFATGTYSELTTNASGTFAFDEGGFRIAD